MWRIHMGNGIHNHKSCASLVNGCGQPCARNHRSNLERSHFIIGPAGCNLGNLWTCCLFVLLGDYPPFDKSHAGCSMNCTCELLKTCFFLSNLGCKLELSCFGFVFSLILCVAPVGVVFVTIFSLHSGARMRGTSKLS